MKRLVVHAPTLLVLVFVGVLLVHGPIPQWPQYHVLADVRTWAGIPRAADVLSNLGFAVAGSWGLLRLAAPARRAALGHAAPGYLLFLIALVLTACGSAFYHLAPDNARLVWDRIPIALVCAGLLAGVRADTHPHSNAWRYVLIVAVAAVASVLYWYWTESNGAGDLRPYAFMQLAPMMLVPLWQALARAPAADRGAFAAAIVLYLVARVAESNDRAIFEALGWISGHTLKHLIATCAAAVIVARLIARTRAQAAATAANASAVSPVLTGRESA